jgi:sugar/nucleoside kinase (ribokinase family)
MSILVVGSVAFDNIATPSGRVENVLGGAATHFALAASFFTEVRVVAVVGDDFTAEHENVLKQRGIDTRGIERAPGKTFRWGGHYTDNLNEMYLKSSSPRFRRSTPTHSSCFLPIFTLPCRPPCVARWMVSA